MWQLSIGAFESRHWFLNEDVDQTFLGRGGEVKVTQLICIVVTSLTWKGKSHHRKLLLLAKHFNQRQPDVTILWTEKHAVRSEDRSQTWWVCLEWDRWNQCAAIGHVRILGESSLQSRLMRVNFIKRDKCHIVGIGLELACNGGSCGEISLKRD